MKLKREKSIFIDGFEKYINEELISRPYSQILEIEKYANENYIPSLSASSGEVLSFLIEKYQPKNILELGTGVGCSLTWMMSALKEKIHITTIDRDQKAQDAAKNFIAPINHLKHEIIWFNQPIMDFLYSYSGINRHDLVFIDCDKVHYADLFHLFKRNLNKGSVLIFDNTLWHGRIMDPSYNSPSDIAVRQLWEIVKNSMLRRTLFCSGDGLLCIEL